MSQDVHVDKTKKWYFWVDRGGTFTDLVARDPIGNLHTHKLLSENPEYYDNSALQGIRDVLGLESNAPLPINQIAEVRLGTTLGTNALLERKGEAVTLVTTAGFADALEIAYQNRPDIFARHIVLPENLYSHVIEVKERLNAEGEILHALDEQHTYQQLQQHYQQGGRNLAIVLMHAYRNPVHEQKIAAIAREIGFQHIALSYDVSPVIKLIPRGDTTVVDAYLTPVIQQYIAQISDALAETPLYLMQSNGGLAQAQQFRGKDSILSGPAGGVVGAVQTSEQAGFNKIIGFDMGGTSTDVSHYAGEYERERDTTVAGVRLCVPMMAIHTVAAGGGSLCRFDGQRYHVGPESAGANPGPCCYRRGGGLTVTDCNVMLGKIQADYFPHVFGEHHNQALDDKAVQEKFNTLASQITQHTGSTPTAYDVAAGFIQIAVENMANAIRKISTQRGYDVQDYALCCFGGAGGQHACLVAEALGMSHILLHPMAGVLSAYGMALADIRVVKEHSIEAVLTEELALNSLIEPLKTEALNAVQAQSQAELNYHTDISVALRYQGTNTSLSVPFASLAEMTEEFMQLHQQRYGFTLQRPLEVERLSVEAIGRMPRLTAATKNTQHAAQPIAHVPMYSAGCMHDTPVYRRESLAVGQCIQGVALIAESIGTIVIEAGWQAELRDKGELHLSRCTEISATRDYSTQCEPVLLEIFNNAFMTVAEQMGAVLANTAHSVNIKERLDFSCAIFDKNGELVANAPHVPVHLGSMGESVKAVRTQVTDCQAGDVFLLNSPYQGGTHLPDLTVVSPVFDQGQLCFYVASRAHHADVGGITAGSVPPHSVRIEEEGILIEVTKIVDAGEFLEADIQQIFSATNYPARNVTQNSADLQAQIAANARGIQGLQQLVQHYGLKVVHAYMQHVQDNAEQEVRKVLKRLQLPEETQGSFVYQLDSGAQICVKISLNTDTGEANIDFAGTSEQLSNNWNAPKAVCIAAVLYVIRTLVDHPIPLNAGCLRPLSLHIPEGSFLNPRPPAAVVAGNVETSQCIVDSLYAALGVLAASQGTMNNFTFGNAHYQYYETICGGAGAGQGFAGACAVQTHMTNSRLTDPEILEQRYPVRLESFSIRRGTGGAGQWQGGDGVVRIIRFLEPMTAGILSGHRQHAPYGMAGGEAGRIGHNYVQRITGEIEELTGVASVEMNAGDCFVIKTPSGGGFGKKVS